MAKSPWAIIKLCLPVWLVESAPHKQAFVFFLALLSPSLLISPFLLSPLLILLLLSSATVAGALSAWTTVKVTRTVLTRSSPIQLPLTLSSCIKSLAHVMRLQFFGSLMINKIFPWLWFVKIPSEKISRELAVIREKEKTLDASTDLGSFRIDDQEQEGIVSVKDKRQLVEDDHFKRRLEGKHSGNEVTGDVLSTKDVKSTELSKCVEEKPAPSETKSINISALGDKEKSSMFEYSGYGSGSLYFRRALIGTKGLRVKSDAVVQGFQEYGKESCEGEVLSREKTSDEEWAHLNIDFATGGNLEESASASGIEAVEAQDCDYSLLQGKSGLRRLSGKVEAEMGAVKFINQDVQIMDVGPNENVGKAKVSNGCSSHNWCQKGLNFEEELDLLVQDIHTVCLGKWYPSLSSNEAFPSKLKILLDICVRHAACIGSRSDVLALTLKLASLFLFHLREFRKARRKKRAAEAMSSAGKEAEAKQIKYNSVEIVTPEKNTSSFSPGKNAGSVQFSQEHPLHIPQSKESSSLSVQEDKSRTPSEKFLVTAGISSKTILQEGVSESQSMIQSPKSSIPTSLKKQKSSTECSLGEDTYYRFRFGHSGITEDASGHYLVNISMYIVRDFVNMVGKLPLDLPEKQYFRDYGSSLAESSPGKILVSMIARKILLPLVETISDPIWLNSRIATLLVDHANAKVHLDSSDEDKECLLFFTRSVNREVSFKSDSEDVETPCRNVASFVPVSNEEVSAKNEESGSKEEKRKSLSLPLEVNGSGAANPIDGRISSVLGGIISATAGPLLPDNVGVSYKPIKRMWSSPSVEEGKELDEETEQKKKVSTFGRNIIDGLPVENKALLKGAAVTSEQEMISISGDKGKLGMLLLSIPKDLHGTPLKRDSLSLSTRETPKKKFLGLPFGLHQTPGSLPHSGLFRSKSSHDVQVANEETWHIEEGSELHEGAYLSDDPGSPITSEKESRESSNRKPGRSRSFHGVKNYNRHREGDKFKSSQEQVSSTSGGNRREVLQKSGSGDTSSKSRMKSDKSMLRVSSEGSMREEKDKVFQEGQAELSEGLGSRWVRYALGKKGTQGSSEGDSDDPCKGTSSHSSIEKGEKGSSLGSFSEGCFSPDVFRTEEQKFWNTQEGSAKMLTEKKDSTESKQGSETDADVEKESAAMMQSSPISSIGGLDDGTKEIPKDISPVYEEVEDLPSTIAKLKALLRERNGSRQMGDSSSSSIEEVKKENENLSGLDVPLDQENSQIPRPQSSPLEERPFSWPYDGGIFLNVRIPYTEICKGTSTSQSTSSNPHVFYCIEYDAAYPEEGAEAAVFSLANDDVERPSVEVVDSHPEAGETKDSSAHHNSDEQLPPSPGTMIHHVVVKRRFQEFLDLHAQLEADPLWRQALKGLKGPTRWINLPFGKTSASTVAGRRTLLQAYLRGVCTSMPQLASRSKALRSFMAYQGGSKPVASGETLPSSVERVLPIAAEGGDGPVPRIDKLFARTVSGMFNTLKTALPGFDSPETTQQSSVAPNSSSSSSPFPSSTMTLHLDPSSSQPGLGEAKSSSMQSGTIRGTMMQQLPAFLQFGNSSTVTYPELVDWDMDYGERDVGGNISASGSTEGIPIKTYSLEDDIQAYLTKLANSSNAKTDLPEFAYEALDPFDSFEDSQNFAEPTLPSTSRKQIPSQYLLDSVDEDGEEEELDSFLPLSKVVIDILCEALRGTGSWISQGTVVHASKVIIGSIIEEKLRGFLETVTTKEMWIHYVHVLRIALFHHPPSSCKSKASSEDTGSKHISGQQLAIAIYTSFPTLFRQIIGNQELSEAAKFIADSLQNKLILRELIFQVLHVCIVHLITTQNKSEEVN